MMKNKTDKIISLRLLNRKKECCKKSSGVGLDLAEIKPELKFYNSLSRIKGTVAQVVDYEETVSA